MCMDAKKIRKYLSAAAKDGACNCGDDHGSDDKNVAPSVVTGKEQAAEDKSVGITEYGKQTIPYAPSEDASLDLTSLALRKDQGPLKDQHWKNPREGNLLAKKYLAMAGRKHPDGTPCKAKSEESCPKMKAAKKDDEADKGVVAKSGKEGVSSDFGPDDMHAARDWYLDQDGAGDTSEFVKEWGAFKRRGGGMGFKEWYTKEYEKPTKRQPPSVVPEALNRYLSGAAS